MYSILGLNVLSTSEFVARFINSFCTGSSVRTKFCWRVTSIAFGNDEEQFLPVRFLYLGKKYINNLKILILY